MAYYCKKCKHWHYPKSEAWKKHRIYASKRPPKKKLDRDFWERLSKW